MSQVRDLPRVRDPWSALTGRREAALLELPSVARMAAVLSERCADLVWVRMAVASLDRFATLTGTGDLEALLARARGDPGEADRALAGLAAADPAGDGASGAFAGLDLGPKLWFRLNGAQVKWLPLREPVKAAGPPAASGPAAATPGLRGAERVALLGMIGSGLYLAELLRLRLDDLGALDPDGRLTPEIAASPLAVAFTRRRGRAGSWVTFFSEPARLAILEHVAARAAAGLDVGPDAPVVSGPDGTWATVRTVQAARRRSDALIRVGSALNVDLCRRTGEFFREWGLPGSRFTPHPAPSTPMSTLGPRSSQ
jgi:hypothetical protein